MTTSQNGWPAYSDYGNPNLVSNPTVPGTNVKILGGIKSGPVATVLLEVARRWNNEVEPLVQSLGCWGFEPRNIRGSSSVSNHASGTAIDLNASKHPMGTQPAATLSVAQILAAHRIRDDLGGVVRWGGDYSGRKDTMHWEINASAGTVATVAARLGSSPAPVQPAPAPAAPRPSSKLPPVPPFPLPRGSYFGPKSGPANSVSGYYSHRDDLKVWQRQINTRGWTGKNRLTVDGLYGPATATAAIVIQGLMGLTRDKLIGPDTWAAAWKELP